MANIDFRERRLFSIFSSIFVTLLTTMLTTRGNGEIFTAMSQWETLIRVETNFVQLLEDYIEKSKDNSRIENLSAFLRNVKPIVEEAVDKLEEFVSHPVNGFMMIKRFTSDWLEIEYILSNESVNGRYKG